jgi:hypothetical protein
MHVTPCRALEAEGAIYAEAARVEEARAAYTRIVELLPFCRYKDGGGGYALTAFVALAQIAHASGDDDGARKWIERAEREFPRVDPETEAVVRIAELKAALAKRAKKR